jgi:hypothetical protein
MDDPVRGGLHHTLLTDRTARWRPLTGAARMSKIVAKHAAWVIATGMILAGQTAAAVDVKVEFDKTYDFKSVRTWAWHPDGPGEVKMARTPDDDPEAMRKQAEPLIVNAVEIEMGKRGLALATAAPDLLVTYYLLLTISAASQTMGQFLPGTTEWGLPPFAPATQSLQVMNRGSLVLDFSANQHVVFRGVAQAQIKIDSDDKKRAALIRESVRDLLRRFPRR